MGLHTPALAGRAFAGVDVGSQSAKSVVLIDGRITGHALAPTGPKPEESGYEVLTSALAAAGLERSDITQVVATGYGRVSAPWSDATVTEITCHATGAHFINPRTRTIIDIGGQDCKVIGLDEDGHIRDFALNDKCAAGTGRFMELMSRILGVRLEDLGPLSLTADEQIAISSTCIVFAESEVISLLARGETPQNIIAAVHHAVARRIAGLLHRVGLEQDFLFSGGGAKNTGLVAALQQVLHADFVTIPDRDPQLLGALGAAVLASRGTRAERGTPQRSARRRRPLQASVVQLAKEPVA
ncbi:MAG TPA: acyl-CoA dehydratase activase [Kineosporiaceae bacterium]